MKLNEAPDDVLVKAYVALRDERALRKKQFEQEDGEYKAKMEKIEGIFLARFATSGHESVRTTFGTAFKQLKTSATVADKDAYVSWILDDPSERLVFLDARCNKTAVTQFKEAENDLPPGVNWREEYAIGIRRS